MSVGVAVGMIWRWCGFQVGVGLAGLVEVPGFGVGVVFPGDLVGEGGSGLGDVAVLKDVDLRGGDAAAIYRLGAEGCSEVEGGCGLGEDP